MISLVLETPQRSVSLLVLLLLNASLSSRARSLAHERNAVLYEREAMRAHFIKEKHGCMFTNTACTLPDSCFPCLSPVHQLSFPSLSVPVSPDRHHIFLFSSLFQSLLFPSAALLFFFSQYPDSLFSLTHTTLPRCSLCSVSSLFFQFLYSSQR